MSVSATFVAGEGAESGSDMEEGEEQEQEDQEEKKTEEKLAAPRKRVGRPLAYNGDPDAPHLTDQERRKIKRCRASLAAAVLAHPSHTVSKQCAFLPGILLPLSKSIANHALLSLCSRALPSACRRIANRESARRVRAKRAELMDELQACCAALPCAALGIMMCAVHEPTALDHCQQSTSMEA